MTTGQLYDDLKTSQLRMSKINKRDHLNEIWSVMKFNSKTPKPQNPKTPKPLISIKFLNL